MKRKQRTFVVLLLALVFGLGMLSMGFQLVASRSLAPHFGYSIVVWAWLISTFLAAFSAGSMIGGWIASLPYVERKQGIEGLAVIAALGFGMNVLGRQAYLDWVDLHVKSLNLALSLSCSVLYFLPVMALAAMRPLAVGRLEAEGWRAGVASGVVYGASTLGNIAGVMGTAFVLIPQMPISVILMGWTVGAAGLLAAWLWLFQIQPETR